MKLIELPAHNVGDVAGGLRRLADNIEQGRYGSAHNVAWVIDQGGGAVSVGMLGRSAEPGAECHLLLAIAQRKLEGARE